MASYRPYFGILLWGLDNINNLLPSSHEVKPFRSTWVANSDKLAVADVRVAYELGESLVGDALPRLSWVLDGPPDPSFNLVEVEIEHKSRVGRHSRTLQVRSTASVAWPFAALRSRENGTIRVRMRAADGRWTAWSDPVNYQVGLLEKADWVAKFVSPATLGSLDGGAPILFKDFQLSHLPRRARIWLTAHGVYELRVNGRLVGQDALAPGWTAFQHRLRYQFHDVTSLLKIGNNRVEILLGNGWYRGQLVWEKNRSSYGDRLAAIAQIEMDLDGSDSSIIATDTSWRAAPSQILSDDLYNGEYRDMRLPVTAHFAESDTVEVVDADIGRLVTRRGPAVQVTETVRAVKISQSPSGRLIADFGQNLVGWVTLSIPDGKRGQTVTIRHAEVLNAGELAVEPLRSAKATCRYILSGTPGEVLQPSFTFSGFRYAEIEGVPDLRLEEVAASVVGTNLKRTGWFACSNPLLEQLHSNVVWGARGNFLDLPTDCPQRDERLGWTGDIQVFAPTANFLFDTSGFLAGWLEDLAAEQWEDGTVPFIIPDVLRIDSQLAAGWGDAAVVVPMSLYSSFGETDILARQYKSMKAWVDRVTKAAEPSGIWLAEGQFGDWLDPTAPPEDAAASQADQSVVATAYYARSVRLLAEAAAVLDQDDDVQRYSLLARKIASSFESEFVSGEGRILSDCQTVYALALSFELVQDPQLRSRAGDRLAELVKVADHTIATGFLGTPHILDALCIAGYPESAYQMLLTTALPSWLYAVEMGATTIWERWDALLPDGTINTPVMTSFNHYAYGAVADWMHRRIGGLRPLEPGYRRFEVRPVVGGNLNHATVGLRCPFGLIDISWRLLDDKFVIDVTAPNGTEAEIWLPGQPEPHIVGWGTHQFTAPYVSPINPRSHHAARIEHKGVSMSRSRQDRADATPPRK